MTCSTSRTLPDRRSRSAHRPLRHRMPWLLARASFAASSRILSPWPSASSFFATHPGIAKAVAEDTAGSVRQIMERLTQPSPPSPASLPPREYGAQILVSGVEDDPNNFTRFALLEPASATPLRRPRCRCHNPRPHRCQSARRALHSLEPFARNAVDLMSLVSRPLVGTPWHYRFFLEVAAAASDPRMVKALAELAPRTVELRVLRLLSLRQMTWTTLQPCVGAPRLPSFG